ncbi:hypothetical protein GEMRC1_001842 [Eukaryota sp. GEM-RC1]
MYRSVVLATLSFLVLVTVYLVIPLLTYTVPSPNFELTDSPSSISTIVHVTDIHISEVSNATQIVFDSFLSLLTLIKPDTTIITGDIVDAEFSTPSAQSPFEWQSYESLLRKHNFFQYIHLVRIPGKPRHLCLPYS